jgi:hypothetical protein
MFQLVSEGCCTIMAGELRYILAADPAESDYRRQAVNDTS